MMVVVVREIEETNAVRSDGLNRTMGFTAVNIGAMLETGWIGLDEVEMRKKIELIGWRTVFGPDS